MHTRFSAGRLQRLARNFLLFAAGISMSAASLAQTPPTDIKLALSSNNMALAPVRIAQEAGIFKKHGLNVEITIMDSGNAAMAALLSGSAQLAAPGLSEALLARARGQKIVVIANIIRGLSMTMVVSKAVAEKHQLKPDSPLSERLRALDNITVALPSATSPSVPAFKGAASTEGSTFKTVYMAQPAMVPALETGAIDAIVAGPPNWFGPVARGNAYVWVSAPGGEIPSRFNTASSACLQAMESYAKANPKVIEAVRNSMAEVAEMVEKRPEEIIGYLTKAYPQVDANTVQMVAESLSPAWIHPVITADDIKHEFVVMQGSGITAPGLDKLDPRSIVEF